VRYRTKTQKYLVLAFILQKELAVATGVMFSSYGEHDWQPLIQIMECRKQILTILNLTGSKAQKKLTGSK